MKESAMDRRAFKAVLASALCCVITGCIVPESRTGNLFLSTRQNFGWLTRKGAGGGLAGGMSIVLGPLFLIGTFTTAPIYDVLCFPRDCCLKFTGTKFIFLDDEMQPIEKCNVSFYSDALPDESPSCSRSSRQGCYSPGIHLDRISRWCLTATKSGYYPVTIANDTITLLPGCQVNTARLDRVICPIPLSVALSRPFGTSEDEDSFAEGEMVALYDLLKNDWLPPFGKGQVGDISFSSKRTNLGSEPYNYPSGIRTNEFYRYDVQVSFIGDGNGMKESMPPKEAGIKLRTAPETGYEPMRVCWTGRMSRTEYKDNSSDERCYFFRIRTELDELGKIKSAIYGKIYGDFKLVRKKNGIKGVSFLYYLNPNLNDRNLEWDRRHNLCPNTKDIGEPRP